MPPNLGSFFPVLSLFFPYLLFINICFLIFWLVTKPKYIFLPIICLLIGYKAIPRHVSFFDNSEIEKDKTYISVISQNLQAAKYFRKNKRTLDKHKIEEFKSWTSSLDKVDVFCFQEQRYHAKTLIEKGINLPHSHSVDTIGTSIYSAYPFRDKGFVYLGGNTKYAAWADIIFPNETVRVYSVHLSSNMISSKTNVLMQERDLSKSSTWSNINSILARYGKYSGQRQQQLNVLMDHIAKSPHPILLCGDLNDVPQSYIYAKLSENLEDSFTKSKPGIGSTYAGSLPGLRIDYILSDPVLHVVDHKVLPQYFSDHFPIRATLAL